MSASLLISMACTAQSGSLKSGEVHARLAGHVVAAATVLMRTMGQAGSSVAEPLQHAAMEEGAVLLHLHLAVSSKVCALPHIAICDS